MKCSDNPGRLFPRNRLPDCAAALLLPMALLLALFLFGDYAPFGANTLAVYDANIQYLDLFAYYKDVLAGSNSIGYTFGKTLGGSNVAVFAYYLASPLNLLVIFFKKTGLHSFFDLLVCLKLGLVSLSAELFLLGRFGKASGENRSITENARRVLFVLLSVSFGLCHYCVAQSCNILWLDGVILLPWILLGVYQVVQGKGGVLLTVSVGCSILFNWYTGGINCLFAILWLVFESVLAEAEGEEILPGLWKRMGLRLLRFGIYMAFGVLLSCALFFPTVLALAGSERGSLTTTLFSSESPVGSAVSLLATWCFGAVSSEGSVSLFCGSLTVLCFLCLFVSKELSLRVRVVFALMTAMVFSLFFVPALVTLFSLLKSVTSYWYRYSYVGIFFLTFTAAYFLSHCRRVSPLLPPLVSLCFGFLLLQARRVTDAPQQLGPMTALVKTLFMLVLIAALGAAALALEGRKNSALPQIPALLSSLFHRAIPLLLVLAVLFECFYSAKQLTDRYHLADAVAFMGYAEDEEAQITALLAYDTSLYRISQTSDRGTMVSNPKAVVGNIGETETDLSSDTEIPQLSRSANYNEALAYGYRSISGYLSSPDANQRNLLHALGYRKNGENYNVVNTSILPADSLLGVRYVLSEQPIAGLTPVEGLPEVSGKKVYENPYALPMALLWKGGAADISSSDPFLNQNALFSALLGETVTLWTPVDFAKEVLSEKECLYTLALPAGNNSCYGFLPWSKAFNATLNLNNSVTASYACWGSPSVFYVPTAEGGTSATIRVTSANPLALKNGAELFYTLNLDELERVSALLQKQGVEYTVFENGNVSISVNGSAGQQLLLSIPADSGWSITRNGEAVEPELFGGCLLSIPLTEGENSIELHYRIPGLIPGALCTVIGVLGLLAAEWLRRRKQRKKTDQLQKEGNPMSTAGKEKAAAPEKLPSSRIKPSGRVEWIDLAKAFGLILVIVGHSVGKDFLGSLLRAALFSFHMPMFFLLSLMTYRCSGTTSEYIAKLKHSVKHLLLPALAVFAAFAVYSCIITPENTFSPVFWRDRLLSLLFASGVKLTYAGITVPALGMPWFLIVLLLSRALFDYLHLLLKDERKLALWCAVLSCVGVLFGKTQWLPFSADIVLAILPFLWLGHTMKPERLERHPWKRLLLFGVIFLVTLYLTAPAVSDRTYLELAQRRYPLFPVCFVCAYAGSVCVCEVSILCCRLKKLFTPLVWVGKNAMWLLFVHMVDEFWKKLWYLENHQLRTAVLRVFVDLAVFLLFMGLRALWRRLRKKA